MSEGKRNQSYLFDCIEQHWYLDISPRQVIGLYPHGRDQRDTQTGGFGRTTEAHSHRLLLGHPLGGDDAPQGLWQRFAQARVDEGAVDGGDEQEGRSSSEETNDREEQVESKIHEDVKDDGRGGEGEESTGMIRARKRGP